MATHKRKPEVNFAEELAVVFSGNSQYVPNAEYDPKTDALECLMDLIQEPDAYLTAGQMVRLGAVFCYLGEILENGGKDKAEEFSLEESAGVYFRYRQPTTQERVNTKYLKEQFPSFNYPDMYQTIAVSGSVSVDLPFRI